MLGSKRFSTRTLSRKNGLVMFLTAILTTIASEIKVVPFEGEDFRFGLGSAAFFLLILIWPQVSFIRTGIVTGLVVVCIRTIEDIILQEALWSASFISHSPAFLFYFLFAIGFHLIKINRYKTLPLQLGGWAFLFELIANGAEQLTRNVLLHEGSFDVKALGMIIGVALVRSYFVVGLYSSITISEQKKRMQEMLQVGSELYAESLYLQKSMNHIEQITASSHDLYRKLKKKELHLLSVQALQIAQEIHEVKKDSQRILSGLTKLSVEKIQKKLHLSDVLNLVVIANERYSLLLKKRILFHKKIEVDFETHQQIPLLALLNNLAANAVESISDKGEIHINIYEESGNIVFVMKDTGKGIPEEDVPVIFEPGYTTKYNEHGVAATGIGLSHVQEIVNTLKGKIYIERPEKGTVFIIHIPIKSIRK
ncbi:sensor histidine kinase [Niallia endozanthoxylica]|uniref:histidine kinase n=1 Tax=Niallia endozanthoxylica TaxID=2036016 RepID=A0A5J5I4K5_9BACI|nr:sensor histidine kinase [Niallia endozanthoxylica]KAA9029993.1 sensor histidine kinase [Niallia endozanthoxylica]